MRSLLVGLALLAATPTSATEWIYCGDAKETVSIGVLAGSFEFLNVSAMTLRIRDEQWSSGETYGPGKPLTMLQNYSDATQLYVDLGDENADKVIAELRVFLADEGQDYVQGGVLRSPGRGAWIVSCEGP
jgi:hypothetical protein